MSEIKVNKISPRTACGTTTLGDSGDTISIPAGVTITNSGTANGFGATGAVNWQTTPKTSTFTAVSGEGYFINQGSAITMNLPAGSAGAIVAVSDYARNFATYNLTIAANGSEKIGGETNDVLLKTDGQAATLVYVDSTKGWINVQNADDTFTGASPFIVATGGTITTSGDCKIHTFTGPGTFTVCQAAGVCAATRNKVSHLVVAGGGAGGTSSDSKSSGAGGGGGFREAKAPLTPYTASPLDGGSPNTITVTAQAYPITVGAGGAAVPSPTSSAGSQGATSTFSTVSSAGGGGGGGRATANAGTGGSGGGAAGGSYSPRCGAAGNTPPVSPAQGFPGGCSHPGPPDQNGAGGGGATAAGGQTRPASNPNGTGGGAGGAGATTEITASPLGFSGGGGGSGGSNTNANPVGRGGNGGGNPPGAATAGATNSGGGGGGTISTAGAAGGSGIVVIRYKFQ